MIKWYGWQPDVPDFRDFKYAAAKPLKQPTRVDLRSGMPVVYDQGPLGSCTAQAISTAVMFGLNKQKIKKLSFDNIFNPKKKKTAKADEFTPSRLFIYYNERALIGTTASDSGAYIRDGIKTVNKDGMCNESAWPYIISQYTKKPTKQCYDDALTHQVQSYARITQTLSKMKDCLAEGYPFVFGFAVYSSFETKQVAKDGIVPLPKRGERLLGGHAVLCVGYDDTLQRFICRNSWGANWGVKGYFTLPYAYLTNSDLAADFWTIRTVES